MQGALYFQLSALSTLITSNRQPVCLALISTTGFVLINFTVSQLHAQFKRDNSVNPARLRQTKTHVILLA